MTHPLKLDIEDKATEKQIDEAAVAWFADTMLDKLEQKRKEGRGGWYREDCSLDTLVTLLEEHMAKAVEQGDDADDLTIDPHQLVDIANLAMFLYHRIVTLEESSHDPK